jgi:drug/metabolite transporter (DMT)-like permease
VEYDAPGTAGLCPAAIEESSGRDRRVPGVGALLALLSSVVWGTADYLGGVASRRLPPVAVVGWSQAAALVAVSVAAVATGEIGAPTGWLWWSVLAGAAGAAGLVSFYTALADGTMGVVSPLAALGVVVPVAGGLLAGDRPSALQYLGMALGFAGALAAGGPELTREGLRSTRARSVVLAVLAGFCFGVALLAIQHAAQYSALMTTVGMRLTSVTIFCCVALAIRGTGGVRRADLPFLAVIGVLDVGANLLFGLASTRGLNSVVAVLGAVYPVVTVLLGAVLLGERLVRVQQAGVLLALGGVALLAAA